MRLSALDPIREAVLRIENQLVTDLNRKAAEYGFKTDQDRLSVFTFDRIDRLTECILEEKLFKEEATLFFFAGGTRYCRVIYDPADALLFIIDLSEIEWVKKVKIELVTSISHELTTPLSIAIGNIQMLKDFSSTPDNQRMITKSQKSLYKIQKIINQLTLLAQAELGNYSLHFDVIDPLSVVKEVVADLEEKSKKKDITIHTECSVDTLQSDRFVLYTIVRNLLSNAIKYSYEHSEVTVTLDKEKLTVTDHGIGIREQEKSRVFERFYRGVDAGKYAKGAGLGLAIVKYLCELCRYRIELDSTWMVGSAFKVFWVNDGV
ncbi:MAG: two-component sensor histidine kinase [Thermotogae bacterium]|nr:two-component sensor histidine kinase [Thermotogota bacterium]